MLQTNSVHRSSSGGTSSLHTNADNRIKRKTLVESQMELNAASLRTGESNHNKIKEKTNDNMAWNSVQKAASTAKVVKNAPGAKGSNVDHHFPHHGQRPSLAGFDPFSTDETASSSSPLKRNSHNGVKWTPTSPHVNNVVVDGPITKKKMSQIIGVTSPLSGYKNSPSTASPTDKRDSRDLSPVNSENGARQPPSPIKSHPSIVSQSTSDKATTTPTRRKKEKSFSLSPLNERREANHPMSSGGKLLSFVVRKGHRRSKSMESKIAPAATQDSIPISTVSEPHKLDSNDASDDKNNKSNGSNSIVQDLMDLKDKFIQLQIPTLAKPSPTSFLTGKGDEAVRTSYYEPSPFQMEIPSLPELVEVARLNDFVENYRRMDQNFDLHNFIGHSRLDMQKVKIKEHIPVAQSFMECGDGLTVQGFLSKGSNADNRLEAVVFEGQRYFIVVFRGTTEQQTKLLGSSKTKRRAVSMDSEQENVEVYAGFMEEYSKLEQECFALIDKLSEQNPFCDVVFSGYSFGAAIATLAASRYATARPMMRVGCFALASPKVGFSMFRHVVNSLPNLKMIRVELGQDAKCQGPTTGGWHVGHTLVLNGSFGHHASNQKLHKAVLAYKFDTPKHKKFKTSHPDLRNYVTTLEEMARLNIEWVKDFVNTSGKGVVVNNEARQVV